MGAVKVPATKEQWVELLKTDVATFTQMRRGWRKDQQRAGGDGILNLRGVNLQGANLSGAGLSHTDLSGADLSGCRVENAYFLDSILEGTKLEGVDITKASWGSAVKDGGFMLPELHTQQHRSKRDSDAVHYASEHKRAMTNSEDHGPVNSEQRHEAEDRLEVQQRRERNRLWDISR